MSVSFAFGQMTLQNPPWDGRSFPELYSDALDLVEHADRLGYHSFWLAEHHGAHDGYIPSTMPFLAAAAARTSRIGLGTGVMLTPFHDPIRIAEDAAVVDLLSNSRLRLGLGLGWSDEEYRMFDAPKTGRGGRLDEFIQTLRGAWGPDRFSLDGKHLQYENVSVEPSPERPIPLFVGGSSDPALRRAALLGDGYFPPSTSGGPADLLAKVHEVMALRKEVGADRPFSFGCFIPVGIGEDREDAWQSIRRGLFHTRGSYLRWAQNKLDLTDCDKDVEPWEEAVREQTVHGSPKEVAEQLRPLVEGLEKLDLHDPFISLILAPVGMTKDRALQALDVFWNDCRPQLA